MGVIKFKAMPKGQLISVCAALLFIIFWMPIMFFEKVYALPGCSGGSCQGLNPQTMGCGNDAQLGPWIWINNLGKAENRFSNACNAEWARTINGLYPNYANATIRWGANFQNALHNFSPAPIASGQQVYSPMVGPKTTTKSCGLTLDVVLSQPLPVNGSWCVNS